MSRFDTLNLLNVPVPDVVAVPSAESVLSVRMADLVARMAARGIAYDVVGIETDPLKIDQEVSTYREILVLSRINDAVRAVYHGGAQGAFVEPRPTDRGSAARFYPSFPPDEAAPAHYHPKANKRDRAGSKHPTIKPQGLMRHYCRLVTPPGGTVLDPFAGSGSTLQAARDEGFHSIGIEMEAESVADCHRRMGMAMLVLRPVELTTNQVAVLNILFGVLTAEFARCGSFWLGTSSSAIKRGDQALDAAYQAAPPTRRAR